MKDKKVEEEKKLEIDYMMLKKTIEDAMKSSSNIKGKGYKLWSIVSGILFKILLPIATIVIALYGHCLSFNNSSLNY